MVTWVLVVTDGAVYEPPWVMVPVDADQLTAEK
jgi:hypothetical protein